MNHFDYNLHCEHQKECHLEGNIEESKRMCILDRHKSKNEGSHPPTSLVVPINADCSSGILNSILNSE